MSSTLACFKCSEPMRSWNHLKAHLANFHTNLVKSGQLCPWCRRPYATARGLQMHITQRHSKNLSPEKEQKGRKHNPILPSKRSPPAQKARKVPFSEKQRRAASAHKNGSVKPARSSKYSNFPTGSRRHRKISSSSDFSDVSPAAAGSSRHHRRHDDKHKHHSAKMDKKRARQSTAAAVADLSAEHQHKIRKLVRKLKLQELRAGNRDEERQNVVASVDSDISGDESDSDSDDSEIEQMVIQAKLDRRASYAGKKSTLPVEERVAIVAGEKPNFDSIRHREREKIARRRRRHSSSDSSDISSSETDTDSDDDGKMAQFIDDDDNGSTVGGGGRSVPTAGANFSEPVPDVHTKHRHFLSKEDTQPPDLEHTTNLIGYNTKQTSVYSLFYALQTHITSKIIKGQAKLTVQENIIRATKDLYFRARQCPELKCLPPLTSPKRVPISTIPLIGAALDLCIAVHFYAQETGDELLTLYENVKDMMSTANDIKKVNLLMRRDTKTFAIIKDMSLLLSCFECSKCRMVFNNKQALNRHISDNYVHCPAQKFYDLNPDASERDYQNADPRDYLGRVTYPGTRVRPKQILVDKLASVGIDLDPETDFMPYFATLDIESFLAAGQYELNDGGDLGSTVCQTVEEVQKLSKEGDKTRHRPASCAVVTTLPGDWSTPYVFVSLDGTGYFIRSIMVLYLVKCSQYAFHLLREQFSDVYQLLDKYIIEAQLSGKPQWARRIANVKRELETYQKRLPVFAFNASYDIMVLLRAGLAVYLSEADGGDLPTFLRSGNRVIHLSSKTLAFLDVYSYLGNKASLANFLKTYAGNNEGDNANMEKGQFPYELLSDHRALKIPLNSLKYSDFWSSLKQVNVLNEDYAQMQHYKKNCSMSESAALNMMKKKTKPVPGQVLFQQLQVGWRHNGMRTLLNLLCSYNLSDTVPLAYGVANLKRSMEGIIKVGMLEFITLSQLAYNWSQRLMAEANNDDEVFFVAPGEELAKLLREHMAGGISTITERVAVKGLSKIKPHIYGDKSETVDTVLSLDANSMYSSISYEKNEVTGNFSKRGKENDFLQTNLNERNLGSLGWLKYMEQKVLQRRVQTILSNGGEHRLYLNGSVVRVDGWVDEGLNDQGERWGTVLEFLGSEVHSDPRLLTKDQYMNDMNPITKRKHWEEYARTVNRLKMVRKHKSVKKVICMWSRDWEHQLRTDGDKYRFVKYWLEAIKPRGVKRRFDWETGVRYILEERIYGIIVADLKVPDDRLPHIAPILGPLIVHRDLSRSNVCDVEREYCERNEKLKKPVRTLCPELSAERMVLTSNLFRFLVKDLGLVCADLHAIYSYRVPKDSEPFKPFVERCHAIRENARQLDRPIEQAIAKSLPNFQYGSSIMRVTDRSTTKFIDSHDFDMYFHKPQFQSVYAAGTEESPWSLMEVQQRKLNAVERSPLHYGFFVLNSSKKCLLKFIFSVLAKYLRPSAWQLLCIDTDSATVSLSSANIIDCVKPELLQDFLAKRDQIFVNPDVPISIHQPGLFKEEVRGFLYLGLGPKSWLCVPCEPSEKKLAAKGINKKPYNRSMFTVTNLLKCIFEKNDAVVAGVNRGIRCNVTDHAMETYTQTRHCFSKMCLKMGYFPQCKGLCSRPRTVNENHPCFKEIYPCGDYVCNVTYESVIAHLNKLVEEYPHLAQEL